MQHMSKSCPNRTRAPWLFAGVLAMSTTPIFRPDRASTSSARWRQPVERPEPSQLHSLTRVCALAPRLPELFYHRLLAAQGALLITEKAAELAQHSPSTRPRTCCWRSRIGGADEPWMAASAAPRLRTSPQWTGGPATAIFWSVWHVVAVESSRAVAAF